MYLHCKTFKFLFVHKSWLTRRVTTFCSSPVRRHVLEQSVSDLWKERDALLVEKCSVSAASRSFGTQTKQRHVLSHNSERPRCPYHYFICVFIYFSFIHLLFQYYQQISRRNSKIFNKQNYSCLILIKASRPVTGLEWPRGFLEVKVPRFRDNGTGWW